MNQEARRGKVPVVVAACEHRASRCLGDIPDTDHSSSSSEMPLQSSAHQNRIILKNSRANFVIWQRFLKEQFYLLLLLSECKRDVFFVIYILVQQNYNRRDLLLPSCSLCQETGQPMKARRRLYSNGPSLNMKSGRGNDHKQRSREKDCTLEDEMMSENVASLHIFVSPCFQTLCNPSRLRLQHRGCITRSHYTFYRRSRENKGRTCKIRFTYR